VFSKSSSRGYFSQAKKGGKNIYSCQRGEPKYQLKEEKYLIIPRIKKGGQE